MVSFVIGGILIGLVIVAGSILHSYDIYQLYKEHEIIAYGQIFVSLTSFIFGLFIPYMVILFAKMALHSIKKEKEILKTEGFGSLVGFRRENRSIYPKKFGLNK